MNWAPTVANDGPAAALAGGSTTARDALAGGADRGVLINPHEAPAWALLPGVAAGAGQRSPIGAIAVHGVLAENAHAHAHATLTPRSRPRSRPRPRPRPRATPGPPGPRPSSLAPWPWPSFRWRRPVQPLVLAPTCIEGQLWGSRRSRCWW